MDRMVKGIMGGLAKSARGSGNRDILHHADAAIDGMARNASEYQKVEISKLSQPIECPCCRQAVDVPSLDIVVSNYGIRPLEARVLRAIWSGKGMPVQTERIFDVMYEDDPDGGPSYASMYSSFKVALCRLRSRLEGSGISVATVGYRRGYRLVMEGIK